MPFNICGEGRVLCCGRGPRELKGIDPLVRRLALPAKDFSCISDLLGSTALKEVMFYDEPITILRPFEAHKPMSFEFVGIENEGEENLELVKQGNLRLRRVKKWIEGNIQRRQEGRTIRFFDKLPGGWVPATIRLMRMVVKKGDEEAGEEAIET
jgi:hypothetical protein